MATHWGSAGSAPDGSSSFTGFLITIEVLWAVLWLIFFLLSALGRKGRAQRMTRWGSLFGLGALPLGVTASTLSVNLDRPDWRQALLPGWHIPLVLGLMAGVAALAAYLGRGAPDEPSAESGTRPVLQLRPGQRVVWVGRVV